MSVHRGIAIALVAAMVMISTAVAGCRNDAPETQEAGSGVKFDVGVTAEPCPAVTFKRAAEDRRVKTPPAVLPMKMNGSAST